MKEENYKDLLTIKEHVDEVIKNRIIINLSMDANDADYVDKEVEFEPETFFGDKKLIYCLAYVSCNYDFKGHGYWDDSIFSHNITSNTDIDGINDILEKYDLLVYCDYWDIWCHSFGEIEIAYYDETGKRYDITFDKIHERWKYMSYEEICEEINSIS